MHSIRRNPLPLALSEQGLIKFHTHCLRHTSGYAQFTGAASVLIKKDRHLRPFYIEGTGRADGCTGPALETPVIIPLNVLSNVFNLYPKTFQIPNAFIKVFALPAQFENYKPLLSGVNGCLEDAEREIKIPNKIYGYGLVDNLFWKP